MCALLLQACVYVPRTQMVYNEDCKVHTRQWTLEPERIGSFLHCSNQDCAAVLVTAGIVTAASVVVSGSIVVAGNVVQWLERRGQCM
jgi:aspartate carbamoyltransferase regulatory subunit